MPEISWPPGWGAVTRSNATSLEGELEREVCSEHVLYRVPVVAIARRFGYDDVLYQLPDGRLAYVHLTWKQESKPDWPYTEIYHTVDEFLAALDEDLS
jgi:hypothetical protein